MDQNIENQTMAKSDVPTTSTGFKSFSAKEDSIRSVSHCSCSQCNLDDCFKLRKQNSICTCKACIQAKNTTDLNKSSKNPEKPLPDKESHLNDDNESVIKSNIKEVQKEIFPEMIHEVSDINNRKYTEYRCKDVSLKKEKIYWNTEKKSYEKTSTKKYIHSVAYTYLPKERENSTVKLSAQVMDMPYEEVKDSLTVDNDKPVAKIKDIPSEDFKNTLADNKHKEIKNEQENTSSTVNFNNLSKPDILARLKEIYKACSCKVCECITTRLISNNNYCGCSPCECKLCSNINKKLTDDVRPPHSGCPCVKCDRKDCKGVVKTNEGGNCDCKPCECVECVDSLPKSCSCLPCQCTECVVTGLAFPQSMVVAPVQGNFRQNICQCEPCECDNCTHNYTAMSSSLRRQISTDVLHGNCNCDGCTDNSCQLNSEACRCEIQNKIIKKPLEKTTREYDVHRTIINKSKNMHRTRNQDTIAMYALSNNYSFMPISKTSCINCHCLECDCLICNEKNKCQYENKNIHLKFKNDSELSTDISSECKCSPCNCQICSRLNTRSNELGLKCFQKCCDCHTCNGLLQYSTNLKLSNRLSQEVPFSSLTEEVTYPRKGRIYKPLTCKTEFLNTETLHKDKSKHDYINHEPCVPNITVNSLKSQELNEIRFKENYILKKHLKLTKTAACVDSLKNKGSFKSSQQYPIRDINILHKCIYLEKSQSKLDLEADFYIINKESKICMQNPDLSHNLSKKAITGETSNKTKESVSDMKIVDKVSKESKVCVENLSKESEITFVDKQANKDEFIPTFEEHKEVNSCEKRYFKTKPAKHCIHRKIIKFKNKTYNKMYRSLITCKKHKINKTVKINTDDKSNNINTILKSDVLTIMEKLIDNVHSEINNIKNFALETKKHFGEIENIFINKMDENRNVGVRNKSWPILKKNLYLRPTHNAEEDYRIPIMKLNLLKNVESISMQTMEYPRNAIGGRNALTQLLLEVKTLLDSPLLQSKRASKESLIVTKASNLDFKNTTTKYKSLYSDAVSQTIKKIILVDKETNCNFLQPMESLYKSMKLLVNLVLSKAAYKSEISTMKHNLTHECIEEFPAINSAKSSCEGLKAAIIGLRTISDHSVMIKWRLPRDIVCVQGYELQVDGRPVQKIFSPTRCMAVLTCLPHSDKLLLTVRTLTANLPSDHNPASTIVYRPRIK